MLHAAVDDRRAVAAGGVAGDTHAASGASGTSPLSARLPLAAIALLAGHPAVKGKADHELVVTALGCGCFDPDELAKETKLPIKRIYQVQRELNELLKI